MEGLLMYLLSVLTMGGVFAILTLGLNVQWGFTGLFNAGIAGFFAIGAYASALLTSPDAPGLLGQVTLPVPAGLAAAALLSGFVAYFVGKLCLGLRGDYLAIATIGIAEIFRLVLKNEIWATNGARGISQIPKPFEHLPLPYSQLAFLGLILVIVGVIYVGMELAARSPWGRVMRAIRENDQAAQAAGKDVTRFRLQAFVLGAMIMGLGGAMQAHAFKFIGPEATEPLIAIFLVWVMLIAGGSGNNRGAILGAIAVWAIWSGTELITGKLIPEWQIRASYARVFLIGLFLQIMLQKFPQGLIPERPPKLPEAEPD